MILVDSNVIMYAAGEPHPHKAPSVDLLERIGSGKVEAVVDVEVLQEILHRYRAIGRAKDGLRVYDLSRSLFSVVIPVTAEILDTARAIMEQHERLSARDAVHAAVCRQAGARAICSYDRDFDGLRGLKRLEPSQVK